VAQTPCEIVLAFAKRRDQFGAAIVGECTENQREVPGNGTAEQRTTKGTMVYRQKDGSMSFTDGEAFRAPNIPVGLVLSSEYCWALENALLAFGQDQTEPSLVLPDIFTAEERQRTTGALLRILATLPPLNANVVMVSHSPNSRDAIGVDLPVEGGAVILKPNAGGKPTEVLKVLPNEWGTLAEALARH
jgi:hypothetical protein